MTISGIFRTLLVFTVAFIFVSNLFAQNTLIKVIDGRRGANKSIRPSEIETELVRKEVRSQERAIKDLAKSKEFRCDEDDAKENSSNADILANLTVESVLDGSFTKAKSSQKIFFYQICYSDGGKYATALGGIIVVEKQKVVSHFAYADINGFDDFRVLPDINRNGKSEIGLGFTSRIDGLMFTVTLGLFEIGADKIKSVGAADYYARTPDGDFARRITVKVGKPPSFYCERYMTEPDSEKAIWRIEEKYRRCSLEKIDERNWFDFVVLERPGNNINQLGKVRR